MNLKKLGFVLILMVFLGGLALQAQTVTVIKVKVQTANVRAQPDTSAAVIKQIPSGTLLEATAKIEDWYEIPVTSDQGARMIGYIHATVVDVIAGGGAAPVREEAAPVRQAEPVRQPVREEAPPVERSYYRPAVVNPGGVKLMAAFGMANMSFKDEDPESKKYKSALPGIAAGIGYESGGALGLEVDLMYLPKGTRYSGSEEGVTFELNSRLTEISLPVLVKFNLPVPGISPYLLGGGEIAYVLSAKADYTYSAEGESESGSEDVKENVSPIDYGLVLGGGVRFSMGALAFFAEARYHLGFANMEKSRTGYEDVEAESSFPKTSLFLIMGGIRF